MDEDEDDAEDDIEASIKKELESLSNKKGKPQTFRAVRIDVPCLLFFKTQLPVDPAEFILKICEEVVSKPNIRRMRYINRLTPVSSVGKATENGLAEVGKAVLGKHFQLSGGDAPTQETKSSVSVMIFTPSFTLSREPYQPLHKPSVHYFTGYTPLGL